MFVPSSAMRGFSAGTPVSPSPQKPTVPIIPFQPRIRKI